MPDILQYQIKTFSVLPLAEPPPCQEDGGPEPSQGLSPMRRMQAGGPELPLHEREQVCDALSKHPAVSIEQGYTFRVADG